MIPRAVSQRKRCVLIVDQSDESREVLRTVLQRRGVRTLDAAGPTQGLELARQHQPDVIVLDLEAAPATETDTRGQFEVESNSHNGSLVVLGTVHLDQPATSRQRFVAKPYHYGPLIRTIEQLLEK